MLVATLCHRQNDGRGKYAAVDGSSPEHQWQYNCGHSCVAHGTVSTETLPDYSHFAKEVRR